VQFLPPRKRHSDQGTRAGSGSESDQPQRDVGIVSAVIFAEALGKQSEEDPAPGSQDATDDRAGLGVVTPNPGPPDLPG
jgi:hypothetical protein